MIVWIWVCSALASFLVGCSQAELIATPTRGDLWIVFPESRAAEMNIGTWLVSEPDLGEYWTPTEEEILGLEGQLGTFLRQNSAAFNRQPPVWEQLENYKRQYAGLTIKGRQVIHGNFFCTDTGLDWTQEWVLVFDGGDCFFQLQFDMESGSFIDLMVNGEA